MPRAFRGEIRALHTTLEELATNAGDQNAIDIVVDPGRLVRIDELCVEHRSTSAGLIPLAKDDGSENLLDVLLSEPGHLTDNRSPNRPFYLASRSIQRG